MISEARLRRLVAENAGSATVGSHVDSRPHVLPDFSLVRAMVRMDKSGVRQLAVVEGKTKNTLMGILTMSDIVRAHAQAAVEVEDVDRTVLPDTTTTLPS